MEQVINPQGSSPRVRGAGRSWSATSSPTGIIPARAGSRPGSKCIGHQNWDHPRACGEQDSASRSTVQRRGSSPRVRGAASDFTRLHPDFRIIPARAGSRIYQYPEMRQLGDHPRACGEQTAPLRAVRFYQGSSPRVRGAAHFISRQNKTRGIIPARAGSSVPIHFHAPYLRDHPRACGEQVLGIIHDPINLGSSPRVRGADEQLDLLLQAGGIIPARAGSSRATMRWTPRTRDHPRACGEQFGLNSIKPLCMGSSPRVRGAGRRGSPWKTRRGIIPARAGSRRPARRRTASARDHPRACGEQELD